MRSQCAFTFIEISISIAILVIGITASMSLLLTGMNWATEAKINYSATDAVETVLTNPNILSRVTRTVDPIPAIPKLTDNVISGYLNGYYIVRTIDTSAKVTIANNGGYYARVHIQAYHGGDDQDGRRVVDFYTQVFIAP